MSQQFEIILGEGWCEQTSCKISYKSCSVSCNDTNGCSHTLLTQATKTATLCPIVSAVYLVVICESTLQQDDLLYVARIF